LVAINVSGILGDLLGREILNKLSSHYFQLAITTILTLMALQMLLDAIIQLS
jgi:uncharacterized membrane protein YfcA